MNNSIHSEYIVNPQLIMPVLSEISYKGESENNPNKIIENFNVKNIISKLLYTNKIFKAKTLTENQKLNVLSSFDKALTVKEVKLVYLT